MDRVRLYLDMDDTLFETESYLKKGLEGRYDLSNLGSVYELFDTFTTNERLKEDCRFLMSDYSKIPIKELGYEALIILKDLFDLYFCTNCTFEEEEKSKVAFAEKVSIPIIVVKPYSYCSKDCVDMSGGILVDDSFKCLVSSNAARKICMFKKVKSEGWKGERVRDMYELVSRLIY